MRLVLKLFWGGESRIPFLGVWVRYASNTCPFGTSSSVFIRSLSTGWWKLRAQWEPWELFTYSSLVIFCLSLWGFTHTDGTLYSARDFSKSCLCKFLELFFCLLPSFLVLCPKDPSCPRLLCLSFHFLCHGLGCVSGQNIAVVEGLPHLFVTPYLKDQSFMLSVVQLWKGYSGRTSLVSFILVLDISKNLSLF